jgi:phosphoenolpyruvate carboxylase
LLTAQRLHPLIRAVEVFGFHLATVDLRQSSDKHEEVVAELLATARVESRVCADAGRKTPSASCCCACSMTRAPCACTGAAYSELTPRLSWPSLPWPRRCAHALAHEAIRHYIISHTETVSDLLEVLLLQKEVGLMRDPARPAGYRQGAAPMPPPRPDRAPVRNH